MSDGRRDMTRTLRPIPRPIDSAEIRVWNSALDRAAREAMFVAEAGEDNGSEACARVGREIERRVLREKIELPSPSVSVASTGAGATLEAQPGVHQGTRGQEPDEAPQAANEADAARSTIAGHGPGETGTFASRPSEAWSDEHRGLYRKYKIERTDGSSAPGGKHEVCEYFVLDLKHDKYAFDALRAYALACREEFPLLASNLLRRSVGERSDDLSRAQHACAGGPWESSGRHILSDRCVTCGLVRGDHRHLFGPPAQRPNEASNEPSKRCPGLRERAPLTHVAVRDTSGAVWSLPRPLRHHDVLRLMHEHGVKQDEGARNDDRQGFLDVHGHYLTRKQALVNAELHGQIKGGKTIASILTSEDLW